MHTRLQTETDARTGSMKSRNLCRICALLAFMAAGPAQAIEYKSVGAAPAVLYDAPAAKGRKVFVAPRGMPVEIVLTYGDWTKVRDASGDLSWIESKMLAGRRTAVVTAANARARAAADDNAPAVFTADRGVLLDLVDPVSSGWVRVRHRDGLTGYVKSADIWGE